tara:strand:- start:2476 stop:3378 length:903 start_codon:yes stop_codon:yes gene_type:complete
MNPEYPVYIVSKGRWKSRLTSRALEYMNVPYHIIVEASEYEEYAKVIDKDKILITPEKYNTEYDVFWDDDDPRLGPGAARNFAWQHSIEQGYDWHWVMDDNLDAFHRLNRNIKALVTSGTIFKCMEDFVMRYDNVAIAGPNYYSFCKANDGVPPFVKNTRIYSCLLIRNDIPYRWRGRYNEDTDICLRALKDGWATIQFNAFLQGKVTTQRMKGGNHQQFYSEDGTYLKSKMLEDMHPDVAKVVWRFNRWHHHVDYRPFKKNRLKRKPDIDIPHGINNYGLRLEEGSEYPPDVQAWRNKK